MSLFELQCDIGTFLLAQRTALQVEKLCFGSGLTIGPVTLIVDKLEFGANHLRHNVPASFDVVYPYLGDTANVSVDGFEVQIAQDVTVYITTLNDILAHPNQSPAITVAVSGTIVVNLRLYSGDLGDENCYLLTKFSSFEPGPSPVLPSNLDPLNTPLPFDNAQFTNTVNAWLKTLIPDSTTPVSILAQLPGHPAKTQLANAGVSVDSQMQRIAFRFQVVVPGLDPDVPWRDFFSGNIDDGLQGQQWSILVDSGYLEEAVKTLIGQGISSVETDTLSAYVDTAYSNAGGQALITTSLEGVYKVPVITDIHKTVNINAVLSVPEDDILQVDLTHPSLKDVVDGILAPFLTLIQFLFPFLGTLASIIIQSVVNNIIDSLGGPSLPDGCKQASDTEIVCQKRIQLPTILNNLIPHIKMLVALADKIALAGSVYEQTLTQSGLTISTSGFRFTLPPVSCNAADQNLATEFGVGTDSSDVLIARVSLVNTGTVPLYLCGIQVLNDPMNAFPIGKVTSIATDGASIQIEVHIPPPEPAYYAKPYSCDLLIATTAGTRLVRIPPPPAFDSAAQKELRDSNIIQIANCEKLVNNWFGHYGRLNTQTFTDPPRDPTSMESLWSVEVDGLPAGETVSLLDSQGQEIVRATARFETPVYLSALTSHSAPGSSISIAHGRASAEQQRAGATGNSRSAGSSKSRGLGLVQQALIRAGSLTLPQTCRGIQMATVMQEKRLVAVLRDSVVAFDLSNPLKPVMSSAWAKPDVAGVASLPGQLLLFGSDGLESIVAGGKRIAAPGTCGAEIKSAAVAGRFIYAATPEELKVYNDRLCSVSTVSAPEVHAMLRVAAGLITASGTELSLYTLANPRRPQKSHNLELGSDITRLARPLDAAAGQFAALLADGSAHLLAVTDQGFESLARFLAVPWSIEAVKIGNALVRIAKGGKSLTISVFGGRWVGSQNAPASSVVQ